MDKSWQQLDTLKTHGLPMPEHFYRAETLGGLENDGLYIKTQLDQLNIPQRVKAAEAYSRVYQESGRYEANTRLRHFTELCVNANKGRVKKLY